MKLYRELSTERDLLIELINSGKLVGSLLGLVSKKFNGSKSSFSYRLVKSINLYEDEGKTFVEIISFGSAFSTEARSRIDIELDALIEKYRIYSYEKDQENEFEDYLRLIDAVDYLYSTISESQMTSLFTHYKETKNLS